MRARRWGLAAVATALATVAATVLSSCSPPTLTSLPAPKPVSGPTYRVEAVFRDALNLTIGAKVKQNGVVVGSVTSISTHDYTALVRMRVSKKVVLPAGTTAQVRFTSPLGEDYVALTMPAKAAGPSLGDGARLALTATSSAPSIEDTFAALSLLLNGGGLDQLGTIVREVTTALHGRTGAVRDTINQLDKVVRSLDTHKADIDHLLQSLSTLSKELATQRGTIDSALQDFPPAIQVLAQQVGTLDDLVVKVGRLGNTTKNVLDRGTGALLHDLDALRPSLDALVGAQGRFPSTMQSLIRFGQLIDRAVPGDYLNSVATINVLFNVGDAAPLTPVPPSSASTSAVAALSSAGLR
jgi:phospholipid/cholesterol/gamma-HCH transport system substrate-binding protein